MTLKHEDIEAAIADMLLARGYFSLDTEILSVDLALPVDAEGNVSFDVEYDGPLPEAMPEEDRSNLNEFLATAAVLPFSRGQAQAS